MRAYFFVNSALSGIQKGLQVAHCVAEMSLKKFRADQKAKDVSAVEFYEGAQYLDWASSHKTIIVLEGGFHADICAIRDFLSKAIEHNMMPMWASFAEDEETMNGMMTCVGIIVPEPIYMLAKTIRDKSDDQEIIERTKKSFSSWELSFIELINSCPLAR